MEIKKHNSNRRAGIILWMLVAVLMLALPSHIWAKAPLDLKKDVTVNIYARYEKQAIEGASFKFYRIGDTKEDGSIRLLRPFDGLSLNFSEKTQGNWNEQAQMVASEILKINHPLSHRGMTDAKGVLRVKLKPGLYLVLQEPKETKDYRDASAPFFLRLPAWDEKSASWQTVVDVKPKNKREKKKETKLKREVIKVFKDSGFESLRPKTVQIALYENGTLKDTVTLSKENNWRHAWKDLNGNSTWTVAEKDVDKKMYQVRITEDGGTFIVENTYIPPDQPKTPKPPSDVVKKKPPILPQTGQDWRLVYGTVLLGSAMIVIGLVQNKGKRDERG